MQKKKQISYWVITASAACCASAAKVSKRENETMGFQEVRHSILHSNTLGEPLLSPYRYKVHLRILSSRLTLRYYIPVWVQIIEVLRYSKSSIRRTDV